MRILFDTPPLVRTLPWIADYTSTILYAAVSAQLFRWDVRRRRLGRGACTGVTIHGGGCEYELTVDPALRWHDNVRVRARDYVSSIGHAMAACTPAGTRLDGVRDLGARTTRRGSERIVIRLDRPDRQLAAKLAHPAFGPMRDGAVPYPDGAGPFRIARMDERTGVLQATGDARHLALDICFVADPEEALDRYRARDVDVTCGASFPLPRLAEHARRADFYRCDSTTFFVLVPTSVRARSHALKRRVHALVVPEALAAAYPGALAPCSGFGAMHAGVTPHDQVSRQSRPIAAAPPEAALTIAYDDFHPNRAVAQHLAAQLAKGSLSTTLVVDDYARPAARADFKLAVVVNSAAYPADLYRRLLRAPELAQDPVAASIWRGALDAFDAAADTHSRALGLARLDSLLATWLPVIALVRLNQFCLKRPALHWFDWNCDRSWLRA